MISGAEAPLTWLRAMARRLPIRGMDVLASAAFVGVVVLSGGNAVAIRLSNRELAPFWGAGLRMGAAAAVFVILVAARRLRLPPVSTLLSLAAFGLLTFGAYYAFLYTALLNVQAGAVQIVLSASPLVTLGIAILIGQERLRLRPVAGGLLALVGAALISWRSGLGSSGAGAAFVALGAALLCLAASPVFAKAIPRLPVVVVNAVAMATAAFSLLLLAMLTHEVPRLPSSLVTWIALLYLVLANSVLSFSLYLFVLSRWPASRASFHLLLLPIVALALSAWLDQEPITWVLAIGGALVVAGVIVGVGATGLTKRAPRPNPP
jgi:drug/metabolite transporter (DMT)-like permease